MNKLSLKKNKISLRKRRISLKRKKKINSGMKGGSYLSVGLGSLLALLGGGLYLIYNRRIQTQQQQPLENEQLQLLELLESANRQAQQVQETNLQIFKILENKECEEIKNEEERKKSEQKMLKAFERELSQEDTGLPKEDTEFNKEEQELLLELERELDGELKKGGGQRKKKKRYLKRLTGGSDINIQIIGSLAVLAIGTFFLVRKLTTSGSNNQHDIGSNREEPKENALIQSAIKLINVNEKPQYELVTVTLLQVLSKITGLEIRNSKGNLEILKEKLKDNGQRQLLKKILERKMELPKKKKLLKVWMFR